MLEENNIPLGESHEEQIVALEEHIVEQEIEVCAETFVGGTRNYERLENKPSINDVELVGNKTSEELGLASIEDLDEAINDLADQIEEETSSREAEIERIDGELAELGEELNAEVNARTQADTALENSIASKASISALNDEVQARTQAISDLQDEVDTKATIVALTAETTNRENADVELQNQIDAITSKSDVVDIVGTYAQLIAHETASLGDNDIIKVLNDETHDNAPSYYRWNKTASTWSYVGSESVAYTKGEADERFVPKTRTINGKALSDNVTLTTNDLTNDSGFVKNTDYASNQNAGVFKTSDSYKTNVSGSGILRATQMNYATYQNADQQAFIGKATLENVIEGKGLVSNTDYSTATTAGVVRDANCFLTSSSNGGAYAEEMSFNSYNSASDYNFIGKGTLENVLNNRKYLMPEYTLELPTTGEDNKLYLTPAEAQPDVEKSATGKEIVINDASEANLVDWEIKGDTEQESYSGKNIIKPQNGTAQNITCSYNESDGVVTFIGTSNATYCVPPAFEMAYEPGTYTLSIDKPQSVRVGVGFWTGTSSSSRKAFAIPVGQTSATYTLAEPAIQADLFLTGLTTNTAYNISIKPMLEKGSVATDYEPYVGAKASPSLEYPQEVKSVTGRNTVTVRGKNLFKVERGEGVERGLTVNRNEVTGEITYSGTANANSPWLADFRNVSYEPGTYTFSLDKPLNYAVWMRLYDENGAYPVTATITSGYKSRTVTVDYEIKRVNILINKNAQAVVPETTIKPMLEKGSSATSFQPYSKQEVEINFGKNLFDKDNATVLQVNPATSGQALQPLSGARTIFVPIKPNASVTASTTDRAQLDSYASVFFISGTPETATNWITRTNFDTKSAVTVTSPSNATYVGVYAKYSNDQSAIKNALATIQIEYGDKATEYAPYISNFTRNLISCTWENGMYSSTTGAKITTSGWRTSDKIKVSPSTQYIVSADGLGTNMNVLEYKEDGTFIRPTLVNAGNAFTTTTNTGSITMYRGSAVDNLQLEEGSVITSYTPNISGQLELCKLGDYQDRIYKDGNEWKIEKQIGKWTIREIDTGQGMTWEGANHRLYCSVQWQQQRGIDFKEQPDANIPAVAVSNRFSIESFKNLYTDGIDGFALSTSSTLSFRKNAWTDGETAKAEIVGTVFYYAKTTPTVTTIDNQALIDQLNALEELTTQAGYNLITTDTANVLPILDVTYFRPDPTVTKDEWLWVENHYEKLGGERKFTHNLVVNHRTAQGHWDYAFTVTGNDSHHYTQLAQVAYYLFKEHAGLSIPVSGTYTEGSNIYFLTKITASSLGQVTIEMRKLSDGSVRTISTGSVPVIDTIS